MGPKRQKRKEKTLADWLQVRKKKLEKRLKETKKTMEECEQLLKERRSKYADLNLFSKRDEEEHTRALFRGYEAKHYSLLGTRYTIQPFARPCFQCRFTFDNLEDEYLIELANYAIEDYNKDAQQNAQLALIELLYYDTRSDKFGRDHLIFFAARNLSNDEIKCYRTGVRVCHRSNADRLVLAFNHWGNVDIESSSEEEVKGSRPLSSGSDSDSDSNSNSV